MRLKPLLIVLGVLVLFCAAYGAFLIERGFSARDKPSPAERAVAQFVRNVSIPASAAHETEPASANAGITPGSSRHVHRPDAPFADNHDGSGRSQVGQSLYPKTPDLRETPTQNLTDGQIHYIIQNGVRLTAMPAWGRPTKKSSTI